MATGNNTTSTLPNSLPYVIDEVRQVREFTGVNLRTCDVKKLPEGQGMTYNEIALERMSDPQAITEQTILDNPQQYEEDLLQIRPTQIGYHIVVTDLMKARVSKNVLAQLGTLGGHSMSRKVEKDYLTLLDTAPVSLGGTGVTLNSGYISAAARRIRSNTTEQSMNSPLFTVLHGLQIHDFETELSTIGTYPLQGTGMTEEVYKRGFKGFSVYDTMVYEAGNITIDSSSDAKGGVHAKEGIIFVRGMAPRHKEIRNEYRGGGSTEILLYDDYAYGFRASGVWVYEIYSNASVPTS